MNQEAATTLTSFSLTHVQYTSGDPIGFLCAGLSLAPVFLIVSYVTATIARRDIYLFTGFVGQLLNTMFNILLKNMIREPRPDGDIEHSPDAVGFSPHGMPSNHAQFVFYFVGFWLPWIMTNVNNNRRKGANAAGSGCVLWRELAAVTIFVCASAVIAARVYLKYHTIPQVIVGAIVGLFAGYFWHLLTSIYIQPMLFPIICSSRLNETFGICDLSYVEDIVAWEHAVGTTNDKEEWLKLLKWRNENRRKI